MAWSSIQPKEQYNRKNSGSRGWRDRQVWERIGKEREGMERISQNFSSPNIKSPLPHPLLAPISSKKFGLCSLRAWGSYLWFVSKSPKYGCFFGKFNVELVLKSFSVRNNSVEAPVLPYGLKELKEFRALISWILG